jgi:chromosome segregation ATPase
VANVIVLQFRRLNQRLEGKEKELEEERDKVMRLEEELAAERGRVEDLSRAVAESADCWTMLETSVCQRLQDFPRRQQQQQQHHHQQQQAQNRSTSVPQSAFATPPREGRDEGREGTETSEDASPSRAKKRSLIC